MMSTEAQNSSVEAIVKSPIAASFVRFVVGAIFGLVVASIPISIAVYASHLRYQTSHYLVLAAFALGFGLVAVVQKNKFGDTIGRVLESMMF